MTLVLAGLLTGMLAVWAFLRLTDTAALRVTVNRIQAHLLEFWLYVDEPWLVGKSWKGLLGANGRFLRLLLIPLIVLSVPGTALVFLLDGFYGSDPLPVGRPVVVTARFREPLQMPELKVPAGVIVDNPPVRVANGREISWRIRPQRPVHGCLSLAIAGRSVEKSISAGLEAAAWKRAWYTGPVEWIEVAYPDANMAGWHWSIWFLVSSFAGMLLARMKP